MDPVTSVAQAVTASLNLAAPIVADNLAQKYDNHYRETVASIAQAMGIEKNSERADALHDLAERLCVDAGTPCGELGNFVAVPESAVQALLVIAAGKIRNDNYLAAMTAKLTK